MCLRTVSQVTNCAPQSAHLYSVLGPSARLASLRSKIHRSNDGDSDELEAAERDDDAEEGGVYADNDKGDEAAGMENRSGEFAVSS